MSPDGTEQPVGREREVTDLVRFLDDVPSGLSALVLEGEIGAGRTTLWREGVRQARARGFRVLQSRPSQAEAALSFSVLGDLFREVLTEALDGLPSPQRHALEVALLLADPEGSGPNALAVSLAVRTAIQMLAAPGPVVIAVDDLHWVDGPSARALDFALRRSEGDPVGFLASTLRGRAFQSSLDLEAIVPITRLREVDVGPLTEEEIGLVLRSTVGVRFPRHVVARLHAGSGGNPQYAIEIGRALHRKGAEPGPGEPLPVPDSLRGVLRQRLEALDRPTRDAILVVAMLADPDEAAVKRAGSPGDVRTALRQAERAGLVELEAGRIRLANPLAGAVLYADTEPEQRAALHRRLAEATDDREERARHLALGAEGPDPDVALALESAALTARARGAPGVAADLLEQSVEMTPPDAADDRHRRSSLAAENHLDAGNAARARTMLEGVLSSVEEGPIRALALQRLGWVRYHEDSWTAAGQLFGDALEQARDDPALATAIELDSSMASLFAGDLSGAEQHARTALERARQTRDRALLAEAGAMVGSIDFLMGQGVQEDAMEAAASMDSWERSRPTPLHPGVAYGLLLKWSDDLVGARARLRSAYEGAVEEGNERSLPFLSFHLAELECWAGDWDAAQRYAREGCDVATRTGQDSSLAFALYATALVDALRGETDPARADAEQGLAFAERSGAAPARVLLLHVLGFIELSLGDHAAAHRYLGPLAEAAASAGIREPGVLRFAGDSIESLISLGDLDRARALLDPLQERAGALNRAWGQAVGARCRGLLLAAQGDLEEAAHEMDLALSHHERLGHPFERARTLLALGAVQRRALHRRAARHSLETALEVFQSLGAPLWVEKARTEMSRIGGRAPASTALTPTEERVAKLVAEGRSNREVAEAMFLTVRTVEWNVARIYRKVGVRSRAELARWVMGGGRPDSVSG